MRQVGAGAEGGGSAGHHDRADGGVGLQPVEGGDQFVDHRRVEGVAAIRVGDGDDRDTLGTGPDFHVYVAHDTPLDPRTTAGEWRKNCSTSCS